MGWVTQAEAADPIGVVFLGDATHEKAATRALTEAAKDTGATLIPPGKVERKLGNPAKKVGDCEGNTICLKALAAELGGALWAVHVSSGDYGLEVTVMVATPAAGKVPAKLQGLSPDEVGAAAYGSAFRMGGGKGEGFLTVDLEPAGAKVAVQGKDLGETPVEKARVKAGALRLEVTAEGFLNYSKLVAVRPNEVTRHTGAMEEDAGDIALVGFGLGAGPAASTGGTTGDTTAETGTGGGDEVELAMVPPLTEDSGTPDSGTAAADTADAGTSSEGEGTTVAARDISPSTVAAGTTIEDETGPTGPTEPEGPGIRLGVPTYAALGGGLAGVGVAAVFGVQAGGAAKAARAAEIQLDVQSHNADAKRAAMTANIFYVIGAVALAAGGYLLYDDLQQAPHGPGAGAGLDSW